MKVSEPSGDVARLVRTNLLVKGWVSTDRSEVAALLGTTPRPRTKSSTNDLTPPRRMGWISNRPPPTLIGGSAKTFCCGSTWPTSGHISASRREKCEWYRRISGRDSDLEAFSHNPSDGSLAPLAYQPSTWTKCLNLRFLSYWAGLP